MKLADFERLKKIMDRTASPEDGEALASVRAANRILAAEGLTWTRVLSRTVIVVDEVEPAPRRDDDKRPSGAADAISSILDEAERTASGKTTMDFIADLRRQHEEKGWLSPKQVAALENICNGPRK